MGDVVARSPETVYATKGSTPPGGSFTPNIVVQVAYSVGRTMTDVADGTGIPNAEGVLEDSLPNADIVNASQEVFGSPGANQTSTNLGV